MKYPSVLLIAITLFTTSVTLAQEKPGSIAGIVKDASTKQPLIEAVITLSSQTFTGKQYAISDSTGMYKFHQLQPGAYSVMFEMEGYQTFIKDSIVLTSGMPLGVSLEMVKSRHSSATSPKQAGRKE